MIKYSSTIETASDLDNILWGGAADRWNDATNEQKDQVFWRLEDVFYNGARSLTDINDYIWFECDDIFFGEE